MLAIGTAVSTALAIGYLWIYLYYIGRVDLLISSLGNVRALLVLFAVLVFCLPYLLLCIGMPALLLVKSGDWLRRTDPARETTTTWLAGAAFATVVLEAFAYSLRKASFDHSPYWTGDWTTLLIALPILAWISLRKNRTGSAHRETIRSRSFWLDKCKAALPGILAWLIAMAVGLPVSQAMDKHGDIVKNVALAALLSSLLLGAGIVWTRWRPHMPRRADRIKRICILGAGVAVALFLFSSKLFEQTMKNVAYAIGMRDRHVGVYLLDAPYKVENFGSYWGACEIGDHLLISGRKLFRFGDIMLICPGNYTSPSTDAMRECAIEECMAVSPEHIKAWIGPIPKNCPMPAEWKAKTDGCWHYRPDGIPPKSTRDSLRPADQGR
jgi:amino acid transporter